MPAPRPAQAITHHPTPRRAHPHVVQSASPATILVTIVTEFVAGRAGRRMVVRKGGGGVRPLILRKILAFWPFPGCIREHPIGGGLAEITLKPKDRHET